MRSPIVALVASTLLSIPALADVTVGVAGPMTGTFAVFGEHMKAGAEQAIADINAAGGILGEKLVLEIADDSCDPQKAEAIANQMVGRAIVMMAGHFCSSTSIPAAKVYAKERVVAITPASSAPRLTDDRAGPGIFRLTGRDDDQARIAGAFLAEAFSNARVAFVHDHSEYGQGLADEARKWMNAAGKKEIFNDTYQPGEKDFAPLASRLRAANIDVLFVGGVETEAGLIAQALRDAGSETTIVSGDALMTEEYWRIAGDAADGTLVTFPPDPARDPANEPLVKAFRARGVEPEGYVLPTYAAIQTWAEAVKVAGSFEFEKVVDALSKGSFTTVLGEVSFDEKGDLKLPGFVIYEWRRGRYNYHAGF
jgi:branched-chain amino acid transport system substrate-binding protein